MVMCCEISQDRADVEMVRFAKPAIKIVTVSLAKVQ